MKRLFRTAGVWILVLVLFCSCAQAAPARDLRKMELRVDEGLRAFVSLLGSASLLRVSKDLTTVDMICEWVGEKGISYLERMQQIPVKNLPFLTETGIVNNTLKSALPPCLRRNTSAKKAGERERIPPLVFLQKII